MGYWCDIAVFDSLCQVNFAKPMEKPEDKNKPGEATFYSLLRDCSYSSSVFVVWETQADTYFTAQNAAAQDEDVAPDGPPRP